MNYQPKPIDTTHVTLSPDLLQLTERLAENAHDLWAAQRLADGWTHGPQRDDKVKKHPCLVTYAQLPESEKEYDRQAAMGTLKAILALGYRIEGPARAPKIPEQ
jgi:ryanodine receptor 2